MVEIVSWFGVAVIALFAVVGFLGVVATSVLTVIRKIRHQQPPQHVDAYEHIAPAA